MKRVFLTGASSGIGLATANTLLARGDEVWGTSRDIERLPQHPHFHPVQLDLSQNNAIDGVFGQSLREAGHFDVLINNAGSGHFGPAELLSAQEISDQFQILFLAHVRLMQLALREMRSHGSGLIVNVTSLAALLPVPFMAAYNAAKAAMASFTMTLQLEMGRSTVRVVDLEPGDIRTQFNDVLNKSGFVDKYEKALIKTWDAVERNMKAAPKPELVAHYIANLIDQPNPPWRVTVGDMFQTKMAPFIFRFLPQRVRIWGLKRYYGI